MDEGDLAGPSANLPIGMRSTPGIRSPDKGLGFSAPGRAGLWMDPDVFPVAYRPLFGELPSAALRRPAGDPPPQEKTASPRQLPESA